jgi:hypothetical protein
MVERIADTQQLWALLAIVDVLEEYLLGIVGSRMLLNSKNSRDVGGSLEVCQRQIVKTRFR